MMQSASYYTISAAHLLQSVLESTDHSFLAIKNHILCCLFACKAYVMHFTAQSQRPSSVITQSFYPALNEAIHKNLTKPSQNIF